MTAYTLAARQARLAALHRHLRAEQDRLIGKAERTLALLNGATIALALLALALALALIA